MPDKREAHIPLFFGLTGYGGSVIAFIADPDGYKVELIERA